LADHDAIAVVDFGGQYAHLIATKIRRQGVLAEIRQPEDAIGSFRAYRGIVLSGSPSLSSRGEDSAYTKEIFDLEVPILGFCFGHQEIAKHYGGVVVSGGREWGRAELHLDPSHPLFRGLEPVEQVWMSHFDSVAELGPGFRELGFSAAGPGTPGHRNAAIGSDALRRYGFQFHPEVDDTVHGERMLANFALKVCGCRRSWTVEGQLEDQLRRIRETADGRDVFLLASGGVDSTVAAVLIGRALGPDRLHLLHIDNGLMRKGESAQVLEVFRDLGLDRNLHFEDASRTFLSALAGVVDPERKRRIIGDTFVGVFQSRARELGIENHLLGQGTIYPDTIETGGTRRADTIKTHHNRVPIIDRMIREGRVIEPLAELYKVEVRELGEKLGLPRRVLDRHPFPGPGLGVRLLCGEGRERVAAAASPRLAELVEPLGLRALPLPVRSVGVKADVRCYEQPVLLTGAADWETLAAAAGRITSGVEGFNRCIWNLEGTAPGVARPLAAGVSRERLELLREADARVDDALGRHGLASRVWQCPTVLVPVQVGDREGELVVVRPVRSLRGMTAAAVELPAPLREEIRERVLDLAGVSAVALDVTSKPPGTIEWE